MLTSDDDNNLVRKELLDVLSEVKTRVAESVGVIDFPIPQFILIGKQSVGKSRIVETLAGETFNFVSGTLGSRRPTVLEFRNISHVQASESRPGSANANARASQNQQASRWFVLDKKSNRWQDHPVSVSLVNLDCEMVAEFQSEESVVIVQTLRNFQLNSRDPSFTVTKFVKYLEK